MTFFEGNYTEFEADRSAWATPRPSRTACATRNWRKRALENRPPALPAGGFHAWNSTSHALGNMGTAQDTSIGGTRGGSQAACLSLHLTKDGGASTAAMVSALLVVCAADPCAQYRLPGEAAPYGEARRNRVPALAGRTSRYLRSALAPRGSVAGGGGLCAVSIISSMAVRPVSPALRRYDRAGLEGMRAVGCECQQQTSTNH